MIINIMTMMIVLIKVSRESNSSLRGCTSLRTTRHDPVDRRVLHLNAWLAISCATACACARRLSRGTSTCVADKRRGCVCTLRTPPGYGHDIYVLHRPVNSIWNPRMADVKVNSPLSDLTEVILYTRESIKF